MFRRHVQTQLRELHKEQHQDIAEHLQELKQLLVLGRDPLIEITATRIERDLEVPPALQTKFAGNLHIQVALNNQGSDPSSNDLISVKDGLEAFFYHFNAVRNYMRLESIS